MKKFFVSAMFFALLGSSFPAHASGIPVVDVANITQSALNFVEEMVQIVEQVNTMKNQLAQQAQHFQAITGSRGMGALLGSGQINRNYLPTSWQDAINLLDSPASGYSGISSRARELVNANKIISDSDLSGYSPEARQSIEKRRNSLAINKALLETTYETASQRFNILQTLISMVDSSTDEKAILDLQARTEAEQVQMQNEANKLQAMARAMQIEKEIQDQQKMEEIINGPKSLPR